MEQFLAILLYILTGVGVLMVFSFWLSDIRLDGKRFRWYDYLPFAAVCTVLGCLLPLVLSGWLYAVSEGNVWTVLLPLGYVIVIAAVIFGGFWWRHRGDDFSVPFYFSLCLFSLVILPAWFLRI